MKSYLIPLLFTFFLFAIPQKTEAQFLNRLQRRVENKVEREVERRAERRADKVINDNLDKVEDAIDGKGKKKSDNKSGQSNPAQNSNENSSNNNDTGSGANESSQESQTPNVVWSKFDFIPGDQVIFEDGPSADEENGEFPSRWDLYQGGAEIAEVDGEPVIMFITDIGNMHSKGIIPYLKDSKNDYLPEVFTIEFDAYFPPNEYNDRYYITFHDRKNQERSGTPQIEFYVNTVGAGDSEGSLKGKTSGNRDKIGGWRHMSIAYTKGKLKVYMDDQRLINIPHAEGNPTGVTLAGAFENSFTKNFRIAKGGVKYYDKVLSDGKIIVNGIKFDVNKATLKPESMGPINKIYKLMVKKPELNFSVEGHTDSDGNDTNNLKLSKARGKAVMEKMISMGISKDRLKYNGFGESKPIDNNSTAEGKANNRRVEFVKF